MTRDTLYLLPPGFFDRGEHQFCPECAEISGVLAYYPAIRDTLTVSYQPIAKPRADLVERLGEKNQNCPTLILHPDSPGAEGVNIMSMRGERFLNNARDIARYWAALYGTALPR